MVCCVAYGRYLLYLLQLSSLSACPSVVDDGLPHLEGNEAEDREADQHAHAQVNVVRDFCAESLRLRRTGPGKRRGKRVRARCPFRA